MDETVDTVVQRLRASAKYGGLSPSVLARAARRALARERDPARAERVARRLLHQVHGAFLTGGSLKTAELAAAHPDGPPRGEDLTLACRAVMRGHASTVTRLAYLERFTADLAAACPAPQRVVDVGCGLNPFAIPWMGLNPGCRYRAFDIDEQMVGLLRAAAAWMEPVALLPEQRDVVEDPPDVEADLALLLAAMTTLDQQEPGGGKRVLAAVNAPVVAVSYPAGSLSGRQRWSRSVQRAALHAALPAHLDVVSEHIYPGETLYILART